MRGTWDAVRKVIQRHQSGCTRQRKIHRLQHLIYNRLASVNTGYRRDIENFTLPELSYPAPTTLPLSVKRAVNKHLTVIRTHNTALLTQP